MPCWHRHDHLQTGHKAQGVGHRARSQTRRAGAHRTHTDTHRQPYGHTQTHTDTDRQTDRQSNRHMVTHSRSHTQSHSTQSLWETTNNNPTDLPSPLSNQSHLQVFVDGDVLLLGDDLALAKHGKVVGKPPNLNHEGKAECTKKGITKKKKKKIER